MPDQLHSFLFENAPVRGALAQLETTWATVRSLRTYPPPLEHLLGEALAGCALLASTIKFEGSLMLQMQGSGPLTLLVAECTSDLKLRATAKWQDGLPAASLPELLGNGRCALTLKGADGRQSYQGVVDLSGATLAHALEHYMASSEQLETRLWLNADGRTASGLLLQRVPDRAEPDADAWNRLNHLAATVRPEELADLAPSTLLRRLFHEESLRLYAGRPLDFGCSCSNERVVATIRMLGNAEVEDLIAERGGVEVTCEFCGRTYALTPAQCRSLFDPAAPA
jgi:molecular chaperone Hsp33